MAEIINIPNLGEARLPLNEYDKMRDREAATSAESDSGTHAPSKEKPPTKRFL